MFWKKKRAVGRGATMKPEEVYVGQKVSLVARPTEYFGTIVAIKKNRMVDVQISNGQVIAYGLKVLTEYKEQREN